MCEYCIPDFSDETPEETVARKKRIAEIEGENRRLIDRNLARRGTTAEKVFTSGYSWWENFKLNLRLVFG